jgi:hypothetical protein
MVATEAVSTGNRSTMFPDVWGYLQDETETGVLIPIKLSSTSESRWKLRERLQELEASESYPTLRIEILSIHVHADGTVIVTGDPVTLWDVENDVAKVDMPEDALKDIKEAQSLPDSKMTGEQYKAMWKSLETPIDS